MSKKIIRGGTVVTAVDTVVADVLVDGEKIAGVGDSPAWTPRRSTRPAAS